MRGLIPGTNGEGPSVALREKMTVLEALFEGELPVQIIPSVMQGNLPDTLEMIRALEDYPLSAVLLPPYYFKPATAEGLKRFYEPVLEATRHPVIIYHIPKYAVHVPRRWLRICRSGAPRTPAGIRVHRGPAEGGEVCSLGPKTTSGRS